MPTDTLDARPESSPQFRSPAGPEAYDYTAADEYFATVAEYDRYVRAVIREIDCTTVPDLVKALRARDGSSRNLRRAVDPISVRMAVFVLTGELPLEMIR